MKNLLFCKVVLVVGMIFMLPVIGICDSNMEGTYTSTGGTVVIDLKASGKAAFTLKGESMPCTYNVKGEKLMLDCTPQGEKVDFVIHGDGSLSGPGFIGNMKKSK